MMHIKFNYIMQKELYINPEYYFYPDRVQKNPDSYMMIPKAIMLNPGIMLSADIIYQVIKVVAEEEINFYGVVIEASTCWLMLLMISTTNLIKRMEFCTLARCEVLTDQAMYNNELLYIEAFCQILDGFHLYIDYTLQSFQDSLIDIVDYII